MSEDLLGECHQNPIHNFIRKLTSGTMITTTTDAVRPPLVKLYLSAELKNHHLKLFKATNLRSVMYKIMSLNFSGHLSHEHLSTKRITLSFSHF
jgi:hypothetical protein